MKMDKIDGENKIRRRILTVHSLKKTGVKQDIHKRSQNCKKKYNKCTRNSMKIITCNNANKKSFKYKKPIFNKRNTTNEIKSNNSIISKQSSQSELAETIYSSRGRKVKRKIIFPTEITSSESDGEDSANNYSPFQSKCSEKKVTKNNSPENSVSSKFINSENMVCCIFCRKEFESKQMWNKQFCCEAASKFKDTSDQYVCKLCNTQFSQQQHLQKHLQGHQRNNCRLCNAQFTRRKLLCKHLRLVHKISESEKFYYCSYCDRKFFKRPSLYSHLKEHANGKIVCTKCGAMNDNEEMHQIHMNKHAEDAKYHCDRCDEKFVRRQQYEQHMTGHDKHVCTLCNTNFSTKKHFIKHRQMVHGIQIKEEKKHECQICNKRFQRPTLLQLHQRIHTGEQPIPCSHCDKSFRTAKALTKHMKTASHLKHVGEKEGKNIELEKPFLCAQCGAKFYRRQGLLRHMQQLHSDGELFECPHCDYKCKCKTNLKRHMELHTDRRRFVCEICGAAFHAFATLKEHNAYVHSEVRNFTCEQCGKGFKGRSGLKRHMRIHSDARPYVCHCGQSYKRMSHLKRHMVSAHQVIFKSKRVKRINAQDSSDADTNLSAQDSTAEYNTAIDGLQDTCDGFSVMLTSSDNNFMHNPQNTNDNVLLNSNSEMDRVALAQVNNNSDYILVSSVKLPSYLDKTNDLQAINGSESVVLDIVKDNSSVSGPLVSLLQSQEHLASGASSVLQDVPPSTVQLQNLDHLAISSNHFQSLNTPSQTPISSEHLVTLGLTGPTLHLTPHLSSSMSEGGNSSCSVTESTSADMQIISLHNNQSSLSIETNNTSLANIHHQEVAASLSFAKLQNVQATHHLNMSYQHELESVHPVSTDIIHPSAADSQTTTIWVTTSNTHGQSMVSQSPLVVAKVTTVMTNDSTSISPSISNSLPPESSMVKMSSTSVPLQLSNNNDIFPNGHTAIHTSSSLQPQELNSLTPQMYTDSICKFLPVIPH
ncbi:zinc finger protein 337-like [Centruroides sculpturatus]|uniref:zinc finger protein 337-like n=1 Tax=Centruroides sculpturatus TaxID=218467 RepID=UPI000C6C9994|nr:zinc finger protein 337-like [Centruroides sculpturatus]